MNEKSKGYPNEKETNRKQKRCSEEENHANLQSLNLEYRLPKDCEWIWTL